MKLVRTALTAGLAILSLAALVWLFQRRLLYFPARTSEDAARAEASKLGLSSWRIAGRFAGWRASLPATVKLRARALLLHGNAGDALDRTAYRAALARFGVEVVLLEYPGYGPRNGSPSERSLTRAALEAVDALAAEGPAPIWLIGESLGTGVAARVAALRPDLVRAVLLVTPYADLGAVAHLHFPIFPAFFLRDRFIPLRDLADFRRPVAMIVAGADEVVTAEEGRRLFAALPGPKLFVEQPRATHNGLDLSPELPRWNELVEFLGAGPG